MTNLSTAAQTKPQAEDEPDDDEDGEVVHIAAGNGSGDHYHLDPDCRYLQRAQNPRALPAGVKPIRRGPCSNCSDE